jgi:hypothetical protein
MAYLLNAAALAAIILATGPAGAETRERPVTACAPAPTPALPGDTAETIAAIEAMGGVGGAAPSAGAQRALDQLTSLMASRDDADSQAAAILMRKYAGGPAAAPTPRCR